MVIGIPILRRFTCDTRAVTVKGVLHIDIDGFAVTLQLPVAGHRNLVPPTHIVVLAIEVCRTAIRVFRPLEQPLSVKR